MDAGEAMNNEEGVLQELAMDGDSSPGDLNPFDLTEADFGVECRESEGDLEDLMREMEEAPPWSDMLGLEMDLPFGSNSNMYAAQPVAAPTLSPPQQAQPTAACSTRGWQLEEAPNAGEFLEALMQSVSRKAGQHEADDEAGGARQAPPAALALEGREDGWAGGWPSSQGGGPAPQQEQQAQRGASNGLLWGCDQVEQQPQARDWSGDAPPKAQPEQAQQGWGGACGPWASEQRQAEQASALALPPPPPVPTPPPALSPMQCQPADAVGTPRYEEQQQQQGRWGDQGGPSRMLPPYPPPPFCFPFYPPPGYPPFYGPPWQHMGGFPPPPPHMRGYGPPPPYGLPPQMAQQYPPAQQPAQQAQQAQQQQQQQQQSLLPPPSPAEQAATAAAMQAGQGPPAPQCGCYGMPPQGQQPPQPPWQYLPPDPYGPPPPCFPFGAPWMGFGAMPFPPMAYAGCQQAGPPPQQAQQQQQSKACPGHGSLPGTPVAADGGQQQEAPSAVHPGMPGREQYKGSSTDPRQIAGGLAPSVKWEGVRLPTGPVCAKYEPGSDVSDAEMEAAGRIWGDRMGSTTSAELPQAVREPAPMQPVPKRVPLSLFQSIPTRQGAQPMLLPRGPAPPNASEVAHARMVRQASLLRYREKKARRSYIKTIRYAMRKVNADRRPRVKGRFVKAVKAGEGDEMEAAEHALVDAGSPYAEPQHAQHEEEEHAAVGTAAALME